MVMSRDEFITICDELRGVINKHIKHRDLQVVVPEVLFTSNCRIKSALNSLYCFVFL